MKLKSEFLSNLQERGMIQQCTDLERLDKVMSSQKIVGYIGFDCTAPSLHAGSMLQLMVLYWLQEFGHKPLVLLGGATTLIGDPSGRDEARQMLSAKRIKANKEGIQRVFHFLRFDTGEAQLLDNLDWCQGLNYIEFLRQYGRTFSVNNMLSLESLKTRLQRQQHLSFLEFNYPILQAYDFFYLAEHYGCRLQIGGSDQWGNIINGFDFIKRQNPELSTFGLTTPLLTQENGQKMGKTRSGAVWLDPQMLSSFDFWQFWRNVPDAEVGKYLRYFTTLPLQEIVRLEKLAGKEINVAKKILATAVTSFCHGEAAAEQAALTAANVFEKNEIGKELPTYEITQAELEQGIPLYQVLVRVQHAATFSEAKRLIRGLAVKIDGTTLRDEHYLVNSQCFFQNPTIKISVGKKKHVYLCCK